MDLGELDWKDIYYHSLVGLGVGVVAAITHLPILLAGVAVGFLIWEGRQRIIKGQPMSHLFTGEQVVWEWTSPIATSLIGYFGAVPVFNLIMSLV